MRHAPILIGRRFALAIHRQYRTSSDTAMLGLRRLACDEIATTLGFMVTHARG